MPHNIGNFNEKNQKEMRTFITITMGVSCVYPGFTFFFPIAFNFQPTKTPKTHHKKSRHRFSDFHHPLEVSIFVSPGKTSPARPRSNNVVCGSKNTEVWDASKLKYEVIDTKLTGAPLQVGETNEGSTEDIVDLFWGR